MADDLDILRMFRAAFTGSVPETKKQQPKPSKKQIKKGEYKYIPPTEKPLERVEAPWEYLLPQVRAMKVLGLLRTGKQIEQLAKPASRDLMRQIKPSVQSVTGYTYPAVDAILRDLNRRNPFTQRMYKKIKDIDLEGAMKDPKSNPLEISRKASDIQDILMSDELGYRGAISGDFGTVDVTGYELIDALEQLYGVKDFPGRELIPEMDFYPIDNMIKYNQEFGYDAAGEMLKSFPKK